MADGLRCRTVEVLKEADRVKGVVDSKDWFGVALRRGCDGR